MASSPVLHQRAVQPRRVALHEIGEQQVHRGRTRIGRARGLIGALQQRGLRLTADQQTPLCKAAPARAARTGAAAPVAGMGSKYSPGERDHALGSTSPANASVRLLGA